MLIKQLRLTLIFIIALSYLLLTSYSFAISSIRLSFEQLLMLGMAKNTSQAPSTVQNSDFLKQLQLDQLTIELDLLSDPTQLTINLNQLKLPEPYNNLTNISISCPQLSFIHGAIHCLKGKIHFLGLSGTQQNTTNFSFLYDPQQDTLHFKLESMNIGAGELGFEIQLHKQTWQSKITLKHFSFALLKPYLKHYLLDKSNGNSELLDNTLANIDLELTSSGILGSKVNKNTAWLKSAHLQAKLTKLSYQFGDNMADNLALNIDLNVHQGAKKSHPFEPENHYQLALKLNKITGEILQNDSYIVPTGKEELSAVVQYDANNQLVKITHLTLQNKGIFTIKSKAHINLKKSTPLVTTETQITLSNLEKLTSLYLDNIFSDTQYEGLQLSGRFKGIIKKNNDNVELATEFIDFSAALNEQFSLVDLNGEIHWNNDDQKKHPVAASKLLWQELSLNHLPFSQVELNFAIHHDYLQLNKEVDIPLFDGALHINSLEISQMLGNLPDAYKQVTDKQVKNSPTSTGLTITIDGFIKPVSLALLSEHFGWPLLDGSLSAVIPSTTYNEKYLKVGGALMLQVFDGIIIIKDLEIVEPLQSYAQLFANIDLNNLNLQALTKTYNFGEIQGRVEGKLSGLELSAWAPVAVDAYIRTPANDDSSHKISQRAIDNLSSLGGASGLLSRSFLSFFETFRYDKIGLSCKLKNNICRMSGVERKGDSYYIVKGGGIPRIDVMGFQRQVNWQVLISRLKAIQSANEAVIE